MALKRLTFMGFESVMSSGLFVSGKTPLVALIGGSKCQWERLTMTSVIVDRISRCPAVYRIFINNIFHQSKSSTQSAQPHKDPNNPSWATLASPATLVSTQKCMNKTARLARRRNDSFVKHEVWQIVGHKMTFPSECQYAFCAKTR